jgi:hypothetical protein
MSNDKPHEHKCTSQSDTLCKSRGFCVCECGARQLFAFRGQVKWEQPEEDAETRFFERTG